ncbi:sugar phosphate isomerase/epimerase family protein [Salirhabdus salicampi]|uniref:sugar phosphate isomerase/epimerase family protein n=1 Tax=Salirhabdus salicampi TaxID=476102 RepID=UPI0020C23FFE|nr:sugar phosphate isomerase/epimerase [Salirhabdus salicampi]MCP8617872.1 sugar phosphate isomerase/epimerase [Salirhabdus salicampi]
MKLATQDKPFFPESLKEKLEYIKSIGFEGFEIDGKLLLERFDEVQRASEATGVPIIAACGGYEGWIGDFDEAKRKNGLSEIKDILRKLGKLGGQGIVVPAAWGMFSKRLPPMVPPRSDEEDRRILIESLSQLNEVAIETGTYVYLEPLNRYEDHMINTLEVASSLIEEGNFSNVKIIADFYHMNIEEPIIAESLKREKKYLGHVHIADSHRYQPGHGHLDFISGFSALQEIGYNGYMTFECRVLGEDERKLYTQSIRYIKECIEKSRAK